jgi:hypothetical protein
VSKPATHAPALIHAGDSEYVDRDTDTYTEGGRLSIQARSDTNRSTAPLTAPIPRVALTRAEAAASLGIGLDSFERHVQPSIRMIRRGRLRLVPIAELERWARDEAEAVL